MGKSEPAFTCIKAKPDQWWVNKGSKMSALVKVFGNPVKY